MKKVTLLLCILTSLALGNEDINIHFKDNILTMENSVIRREYNTLGNFYPVSLYQKNTYQNYITEPAENWFKFIINGDTVETAQYQSHAIQPLKHGGTELDIRLENGEYIFHYMVQMYPHCSMTRERMNIHPRQKSISFTPIADKDMYHFPVYNLARATDLREIKLATWNNELDHNADLNSFPANRQWGKANESGANLSQNHMDHPVIRDHEFTLSSDFKGPVLVAKTNDNTGWLIAYEHGSPDNDPERDFINISITLHPNNSKQTMIKAKRGAFTPNELFTPQSPLQTEWVLVGLYEGESLDSGINLLWHYLYHWQSESLATRIPRIYYNTWGWQRDDQSEYIHISQISDTKTGTDIYGDATEYPPLTYHNINSDGGDRKNFSPRDVLHDKQRLLQEIDYAHECGVDIFVIDDGWFDYMGDWNVNKKYYNKNLAEIRKKLDAYNMRLGLWMAPMCVHKDSKFHAKHKELLAMDSLGNTLKAGWGRDMVCMVSGFEEYFTQKCKSLIDMGCTYFKWDGLDGQLCYADNHHHGGPNDTPQQRAERYGFEFINTITRIAKTLTEYNPDVLIVYDITEKGRNVGLEFTSAGRYFWMNNGASWYDDMSTYRTKSLRTIPKLYNQIIPPVLQTWAVYPQNGAPYNASQYNLCSAILGGHGIWGDLSEMSAAERKQCGYFFNIYKKVAASAASARPVVTGSIGSSPEIYEQINADSAAGHIVAFSGSVLLQSYRTKEFKTSRFLGALGHAYHMPGLFSNFTKTRGNLELTFQFTEPDAARYIFLVGGNSFGAFVGRSTCWLKNIEIIENKTMKIEPGAPGIVNIYWPEKLGPYHIQGATESGTMHTGRTTVIEVLVENTESFTISKE